MSSSGPPSELIGLLAEDFPSVPFPRIEALVEQGWARTDPAVPDAHRIAVTERFVRLALREPQ